jgi:putative transposase
VRFWLKGKQMCCKYTHFFGISQFFFAEYVRNQLQEDQITDQIGLQEYFDPFTGEPAKKGKK